MSTVQTSAERTPHDLGRFVYTCGDIGRLKTLDAIPVMPGDSFSADMSGVLRMSPLRRGLVLDSKVDICTFYIPHRHTYGQEWVDFMLSGYGGGSLSSTPCGVSPWALGFAGAVPGDSGEMPKWLFEGYKRIFNHYFRNPALAENAATDPTQWTEAERRNGLGCCHLKNIWTAPLPDDVELSFPSFGVDGAAGTVDIMAVNAAYGVLHSEQERTLFMRRYRDVMDNWGGSTHYDADQRPHLLARSEFWSSGYDVDGTDANTLGQFSGRSQQSFEHRVPRFYVPEHGAIITVALVRFPPIHLHATPRYIARPNYTYTDIANDPAIIGNLGPQSLPLSEFFRHGSPTNEIKMTIGQEFRTVPDFVDERYGAVEGFPFLTTVPLNAGDCARIIPSDYDGCFQSLALSHWNAQLKTNVMVLRALPTAREEILAAV